MNKPNRATLADYFMKKCSICAYPSNARTLLMGPLKEADGDMRYGQPIILQVPGQQLNIFCHETRIGGQVLQQGIHSNEAVLGPREALGERQAQPSPQRLCIISRCKFNVHRYSFMRGGGPHRRPAVQTPPSSSHNYYSTSEQHWEHIP